MAALHFAIDIILDGEPFKCARGGAGDRQVAVSYVPKIKSSSISADGQAMLDPIEYTSFHRGAGASRNVGIPGMVAWGENIWTCDPGLLLPGPEVTSVTMTGANVAPRPDGVAEAEGHIFVAAGRYIFKLTNGVGPVTQDHDTGLGNVARAIRRFGSSLFASGNGNLRERGDGGGWVSTQLGAQPVIATGGLGTVWWTTGGVTTERLVAQVGTRAIRYAASSPRLDTSWTPGFSAIGIDMGGNIVRLVTTLTHLYVSTTSGLRDLDSTGLAPNLVPQAETMVLPSGGLAAMAADGVVYYSAGYDLFAVQTTGLEYAKPVICTPMAALPNETPVARLRDRDRDQRAVDHLQPVRPRQRRVLGVLGPPGQHRLWPRAGRRHRARADRVERRADRAARLEGHVAVRQRPGCRRSSTVDVRHDLGRRGLGQVGAAVVQHAVRRSEERTRSQLRQLPLRRPAVRGRRRELDPEGSRGASVRVREPDRWQQRPVPAQKEDESAFTPLARFTNGPRVLAKIPQAYFAQRPTFRLDMYGSPNSPPIARRLSVRWLPNPDTREVRRYTLKLGRDERMAGANRAHAAPTPRSPSCNSSRRPRRACL